MNERLKGYPKKIESKPGVVITSVRHGPKDTSKLESKEHSQDLTPEGREMVRREAEAYFEFLVRTVPAGAVISLSSSAISRAGETKQIFIETIRECARLNAASSIVLVKRYRKNGMPRTDKDIRRDTKDPTLRYVITDELADEDLGYRRDENDNITPFNGAMEFFKDEHLVSMIWAARPEELGTLIDYLHQEMKRATPDLSPDDDALLRTQVIAEVGKYIEHSRRTPEELVANQLEAIERSVSSAMRIRPERTNVLHFSQHAPGLSFLALELFGQRISFETYHALGDYQHYLEGLSFEVDTEGRVVVADFRTHRSSIEPVRIRDIITRLYKESDDRKEAWKEYRTQVYHHAA